MTAVTEIAVTVTAERATDETAVAELTIVEMETAARTTVIEISAVTIIGTIALNAKSVPGPVLRTGWPSLRRQELRERSPLLLQTSPST